MKPDDVGSLGRDVCLPGKILNFNTESGFIDADRRLIMAQEMKHIIDDIFSGRAIEDPSLLSPFVVISFADLKSHSYSFR